MTGREESRLHTSVLVSPESERRKHRKACKQAAAEVVTEQQRQRKAEAKARIQADRAERRATT